MNTVILRLRGRWTIRGPDLLTRAVATAMTWRERARQRRTLASFDDRMLMDVGLGRAELESEADKPPWRL